MSRKFVVVNGVGGATIYDSRAEYERSRGGRSCGNGFWAEEYEPPQEWDRYWVKVYYNENNESISVDYGIDTHPGHEYDLMIFRSLMHSSWAYGRDRDGVHSVYGAGSSYPEALKFASERLYSEM